MKDMKKPEINYYMGRRYETEGKRIDNNNNKAF